MQQENTDPFRSGTPSGMNTLTECLNLALRHGYTESFSVLDSRLSNVSGTRSYTPQEVHIVNFYRFEGPSNPDDMAILYAIETNDGLKGTLIDAYGTYADDGINGFILQVENMHKKTDNIGN